MKTAHTLGGKIQSLRTEAGLTLRGFALKVEISAAFLSDIERDRRRPSEAVLRRIAKQLPGTTYEELDALSTTLEQDLQRMVAETPEARQLLRTVFESKRDPREVLRELQKSVPSGMGKSSRRRCEWESLKGQTCPTCGGSEKARMVGRYEPFSKEVRS
jgi:transcriptional regulator with XRE-family HTH domain